MVRAAESIVFNIVEGSGSRGPKEFAVLGHQTSEPEPTQQQLKN